jgi:hypothetical protein
MRMVLWMWVLLAACNGDDGARHIVDGQGSGSGSAGPIGEVSFDIYPDSSQVYASAYFATVIDTTLPSYCTQSVQGGCQLTLCSQPFVGGTGTYASAGTITVVGGTPATTYTLVPTDKNAYTYGPLDNTAVFSDGDTVIVAGTGGTVPAFSQALTIPTIPQITAPAMIANVPRASDLTVAWTGGNHLAFASFEIYKTTPTYEVLVCSVTDTANSGSMILPSTLLEMMTPGAVTGIGFGDTTTTAMVGEFQTTFSVGGDLVGPDGDVYVGRLTLQ